MQTQWRIDMLGGLCVARQSEDIGSYSDRELGGALPVTRFRTRKTALLLACLALAPDRAYSRVALVDLFWRDAPAKAGHGSLSTALSWLRRLIGPALLADRREVGLDSRYFTTDVGEFKECVAAAGRVRAAADKRRWLERALQRYRGEFLPGYSPEWVLQERRWLEERFFQALADLLACLEQMGEWEQAVELARRGVAVDPLREEAHQNLIRLLVATGQTQAAGRQYRSLEQLLTREFGELPMPATRALLEWQRGSLRIGAPAAA